MAGDGKRYPVAAVGHSDGDEIIQKRIRFSVPSTHACHKVFHACLRFIQEHTGYLSLVLIICIQGTCRRETKYQQGIWKQHHQQHSMRLTNTDRWC